MRFLFKYVTVTILITFLYAQYSFAITPVRTISNPQLSWVGTRFLSLGGTSPAIKSDLSGVLINPASLASISSIPVSISQKKLLNEYNVLLAQYSFNYEMPLQWLDIDESQKFNIGINYGENILTDIPSTIKDSSTIRQVSSYGSGFRVMSLSAATSFYSLLGFDELYTGVNFKRLSQFVSSESRAGYSMDIGAIAVLNQKIYFLDQISFGGSILNFVPLKFKWTGDKGEANVPLQFILGAKFNTLNNNLAFLVQNSDKGFGLGSELFLENGMILRAGTTFKEFNLGLGIIFDQLTGIGNDYYSVRVDFNYTQNQKPFNSEPSYSFGFTVLGDAKLETPKILIPKKDLFINERELNIHGIGPANTVIQLFNNGNLSRTVKTDRYGYWKKENFPLNEGKNNVYARAYSLEKEDSLDSENRLITTDTIPPELDIIIYPVEDKLIVEIASEDTIDEIDAGIDGKQLKFYSVKEGVWQAEYQNERSGIKFDYPPREMRVLSISAKDKVGNVLDEEDYPFFMKLDIPANRHVHYDDTLRLLGSASYMINQITINNEDVYIDDNNNFSFSHYLEPGKNLVDINYTTLNDIEVKHNIQVLSLISYDDIKDIEERRDIEFLSTLGVLNSEEKDNFFPENPVTKAYLTRLMVTILGFELPKVEETIFPDVAKDDPNAPYIAAAVQNGLVFADVSGLFLPEEVLTQDQIGFLLQNSEIITSFEENREEEPMTRRELATYLATQPEYEIEIERLIDWEIGY